MELKSYILGKNAGGGGGGGQELIITSSSQSSPGFQKIIEQIDEITLDLYDTSYLFYGYLGTKIPKLKGVENSLPGYALFQNAGNIKSIDLSYWKATLTNSGYMFRGTYNLAVLDISGFEMSSVPSYLCANMFTSCGQSCLKSDGAYADGIPYIYVKDQANKDWILNTSNGHPSTWTTANVVIKS